MGAERPRVADQGGKASLHSAGRSDPRQPHHHAPRPGPHNHLGLLVGPRPQTGRARRRLGVDLSDPQPVRSAMPMVTPRSVAGVAGQRARNKANRHLLVLVLLLPLLPPLPLLRRLRKEKWQPQIQPHILLQLLPTPPPPSLQPSLFISGRNRQLRSPRLWGGPSRNPRLVD